MTTLDLKIKTIQNLMEKAYNDEYVRLHNQLTELIRERKAQKQTQHGGNHEIRKRQDW